MDEPSSYLQFLDTTSYISATPFLSRRIPIFGVFVVVLFLDRAVRCLRNGWGGRHAGVRRGYSRARAFNTEGTENTEIGKRNSSRKNVAFLLFSVPLCALCGEFFWARS